MTSSSAASSSSSITDDDYVSTAANDFVSRNATIHAPNNLQLGGRTIIERDCLLHAEASRISLGRYCYIHQKTTIYPPIHAATKKPITFTLGSHSTIGAHCEIRAAAIGSHCYIGNHVVLGDRVIIKDGCYVADGTILPSDTVLPPFTRVQPTTQQQQAELQLYWPNYMELPIAVATQLQEQSIMAYEEFVLKQKQ